MARSITYFILSFICCIILFDTIITFSLIKNTGYNEFYNDIGRGRRKNYVTINMEEGFSVQEFNQFRFVDKDFLLAKPKNTIRIGLFGDSFIESFQVFESQHFKNVAEVILKSNGYKVELLNLGHSGFNLADMFIYMNALKDSLDIDLSLFLIRADDLTENQQDPYRPILTLSSDSLVINPPKRPNYLLQKLNKFKNHSALANTTILALKKLNSIKKNSLNSIHPKQSIQSDNSLSNSMLTSVNKKILDVLDPATNMLIWVDQKSPNLALQNAISNSKLPVYCFDTLFQSLSNQGFDPYYWAVTNTRGHWNYNTHRVLGASLAQLLISNYFTQSDTVQKKESVYSR